MINTESILNDAISQIADQSTAMRAKLLIWLNNVMQDVAGAKVKKPWKWLVEELTDQTLSGNAIARPSDYKYLYSVKSGSDWILTQKHIMTEDEIFTYTDTTATNPTPIGYDETSMEIVFYPGATGTCDLKYIKEVPEYSDSPSDTIFPLYMKNVLIQGTLAVYYDYDEDVRASKAAGQYGYLLGKAMKEDNISNPIYAPYNRRGYIRK